MVRMFDISEYSKKATIASQKTGGQTNLSYRRQLPYCSIHRRLVRMAAVWKGLKSEQWPYASECRGCMDADRCRNLLCHDYTRKERNDHTGWLHLRTQRTQTYYFTDSMEKWFHRRP